MTWQFLTQLILQYGIPFADKMFEKWANKTPVTQAEWDELKALANGYARDQMLAALQRAQIDPNSEQGKIFLGLTAV